MRWRGSATSAELPAPKPLQVVDAWQVFPTIWGEPARSSLAQRYSSRKDDSSQLVIIFQLVKAIAALFLRVHDRVCVRLRQQHHVIKYLSGNPIGRREKDAIKMMDVAASNGSRVVSEHGANG